MIGGFFDHYYAAWDEEALAWFEALLEEDDVEVMAWALNVAEPPERFRGRQLEALRRLDYVSI